MPDTFTANLALVKPEVGASRDTWGSKTNSNWDIVDQLLSMAMPIGAILDYAGPTPPPGYLVCDGRLVSRVTYAALFAAIGTFWSAGDGSTTFGLPKIQGRALVGPGTVTDPNGTTLSLTFAQQLGWLSNQILQTHLPNYALSVTAAGTHSHGGATVGAGSHGHTTDVQGQHSHSGATAGENANHTHSGVTDVQGTHAHTYAGMYAGGPTNIGTGPFGAGNQTATSTDGAHQHNFTTGIESTAHAHAIAADGSHAHNVSVVGDHTHTINPDGSHVHTVNLGGGGTLFGLMQPVICVTKIIYAGQQAVTHAVGEAAPTIEGRDELAVIREELAQLRAILAPARSPRLLSAPARGMH
jgi:microcystin-dependent protein